MFNNSLALVAATAALASVAPAQSVGTSFCSPTNNSTGAPALLAGSIGTGTGSNLHLEVTQGVPSEIGYCLVGNENLASLPISAGLLCLGGTPAARVYRYNVGVGGSNSIGQFNALGDLQNLVGTSSTGSGFDVPSTIPDTVPIPIMSGDTWHFQLWYRDTPTAAGTSNFSSGLSVTFPVAIPLPTMVSIPAGGFLMGSNATNLAPYFNGTNQQPVHSVTLSSGFLMSTTEVTQAEYEALMGTNPASNPGPNLPVEGVSWFDARAYCAALTAHEQLAGNVPVGMEYRLPTEAEWEYACRAGTTTEFYLGNDLFCSDARFAYSEHSNSFCPSGLSEEVAGHPANAFGLYDMHGNVFEWCLDTYFPYTAGPASDPFQSGGSFKVFRGGSWSVPSYQCRSAHRRTFSDTFSTQDIGFRVVLAGILVP